MNLEVQFLRDHHDRVLHVHVHVRVRGRDHARELRLNSSSCVYPNHYVGCKTARDESERWTKMVEAEAPLEDISGLLRSTRPFRFQTHP
jgi:hypothetical protein